MSGATRSWSAACAGFLSQGGQRGTQWLDLPRFAPLFVLLPCAVTYGVVMASFAGIDSVRIWYVLIGAVKVPILFGMTLFIAVPCFYVFHMLLGVGDDFSRVWSALVDYQLSVAMQLFALAPVTLLVNITVDSYRVVQSWNVLIFAMVAFQAQRSLRVVYASLIESNSVHRHLSRFWLAIYAFVGIQLGWTLRPFFGHPDLPPQFFRDEIGNAYVEVFRILQRALEHML